MDSSKDVPLEIQRYDIKTRQNSIGKNGLLKIVLVKNAQKTLIKDQISEAPLHLQKALYYQENLPSMAYLYMASSSGGILQGDRYKIDITLDNDATAHITTQGATRIYGMSDNYATQTIDISLNQGAYLEFMPDQIIPYKNSRYFQKMNVKLCDESTLVYSEIITPGRTAMGESFEYDICYIKTEVKNDDTLLFTDAAKLEPKKQRLQAFGILGENTVVATVYILTKKDIIIALEEEIDKMINNSEITAGTTILPNDIGVMVRLLGDSTESIKELIYEIAKITRKIVIDAPFVMIRKS